MIDDIAQREDKTVADLCAALRERLVFMRGELIERLVRGGIDAGMLSLLGSVGAALAAIDAVPEARLPCLAPRR